MNAVNNLELVKSAIEYIAGLTLSGSALFVSHGFPYKEIRDIDVFCSSKEAEHRFIKYLNDNGYKGYYIDSYGNCRSTTFDTGEDKPITIHYTNKDKILNTVEEVVAFKLNRFLTAKDKTKSLNDIKQIKLLCDVLLEQK